MNVLLMEAGQIKLMPTDVHIRNSIVLSKELGWDLIGLKNARLRKGQWNDRNINLALRKKYDRLVYVYSSYYINSDLVKKILDNNSEAKLFWITNEYNLHLNSVIQYSGRNTTIISNYEKQTHNANIEKFYCLNLNILIAREPNPMIEKKYDIIYYGTFRPDRQDYFRRYLQKGVYLSCTDKNFKKYKHIGCNPIMIKKLSWKSYAETLNYFKYSLYIEDKYTHDVYNHLANRFYEAGFCNCILLFDIHCINTLERAGVKVKECFVVENYKDMMRKIKFMNTDFEKHLDMQKEYFQGIMEERSKVLTRINNIVERG